MTVRPETGKFYKTRDGQKAGPISFPYDPVAEGVVNGKPVLWYSNGSYYGSGEHPLDLVAEWTDEPKTWGELTDAEKGALLLARYRGETIQFYSKSYSCDYSWAAAYSPTFKLNVKYRVKPKPEVKTVPVSCYMGDFAQIEVGTIDLIDGKPDLTSLKARADE